MNENQLQFHCYSTGEKPFYAIFKELLADLRAPPLGRKASLSPPKPWLEKFYRGSRTGAYCASSEPFLALRFSLATRMGSAAITAALAASVATWFITFFH